MVLCRLDRGHGCGQGYFAIALDPMKGNQKIIPNMFIKETAKAEDPSRVRVTNANRNNVTFNGAIAYYE